MAREQTFSGVNASLWQHLKAQSTEEFGTVYEPPDANQGVATTRTPIGEVVLAFDFQPETETLTYRIEKKPVFLTAKLLFDGTQERIDALKV